MWREMLIPAIVVLALIAVLALLLCLVWFPGPTLGCLAAICGALLIGYWSLAIFEEAFGDDNDIAPDPKILAVVRTVGCLLLAGG